MAGLYLQRGEGIRVKRDLFASLGIRVEGPVLSGKMGVREAQQVAQVLAQREADLAEREQRASVGKPGARW